MTVLDAPTFTPDLAAGFLARTSRDDFPRFEAQLRSSGYCAHPIRLKGHVRTRAGEMVWSTDTEPDGVLRKACGNRREAICPTCAETYRQDSFQLFAAGLRGGKGVPETVKGHPTVFVTLTAPSFGIVHTRRQGSDGQDLPCRPRRNKPTCKHGKPISCGKVHAEGDPVLGQAMCQECFKHDRAVMWNNSVGELWRCTSIYLGREIAKQAGLTAAAARREVRPAYAKVSEYHARGLLHFHVVVRLDRAMPDYRADQLRPPSAKYTTQLLEDAVRAAIPKVKARASKYFGAPYVTWGKPPKDKAQDTEDAGAPYVSWGKQLDVRQVVQPKDDDAARFTAEKVAGYLAKYGTKSTEQAGGLLHPVRREQVETVPVSGHVRRYLRSAFRLHGKIDPHIDAARKAHALEQAAEADLHPEPSHHHEPGWLVYRALHAMSHDEHVRVGLLNGERRRSQIVKVSLGPLRLGHTRQITLATGETIHLADVSTITHRRLPFVDRQDPRLDRVAHQFGYRGHCLTKSRRYSTTFTDLRQARAEHVRTQLLEHHGGDQAQHKLAAIAPEDRIRRFEYVGRGHFTTADAYMAAKAAAQAREGRQLARQALREERTTKENDD